MTDWQIPRLTTNNELKKQGKVSYEVQTDDNLIRIILPDETRTSLDDLFILVSQMVASDTTEKPTLKIMIIIVGNAPSLTYVQQKAQALMKSYPGRKTKVAILFEGPASLLSVLEMFIRMLRAKNKTRFYAHHQEKEAMEWLLEDE